MQTQEQEEQNKESASDDNEIEDLEREAEGLDGRIEKHRKRLKEIIQRLAKLYETKFIREDKRDEIKTICTIICKRFPNKRNIRSTAAKDLDDKYKMWTWDKKPINVDKVTLESEEYKIGHSETAQSFEKISSLPPKIDKTEDFDNIRRNADICYNYIRKAEELAEETGKDLSPARTRYGSSNYLRKKFEPDDDRKSLEKPSIPENEDIIRLKEIANDKIDKQTDLLRKTLDYIGDDSESKKILEDFIFGLEADIKVIEPEADDRHAVDWEQYSKYLIDNRILKSSNRKGGPMYEPKFVINRKTGKVEFKGEYTEEQILNELTTNQDDLSLSEKWIGKMLARKVNDMYFITKHYKVASAICRNFRNKKHGLRKKRKQDLHETLSEGAFGSSKRKGHFIKHSDDNADNSDVDYSISPP